MAQLKSTNITGNLSVTGNVLASKIMKTGGTGEQFLMADGSIKTKSDLGIGSGNGSVTSVGLSVPTGLTVSGSPVTGSGTLAITFTEGYSIPTTAKQGNWDAAYAWGDHAEAGYQPGDADLTAIAGLTGTSGFLKKTAANTWALETLSIPAAQIQSDWNQTDNTKADFIKNKPTIPSVPDGVITGGGSGGYLAVFEDEYVITDSNVTHSDGVLNAVGYKMSNKATWKYNSSTDCVELVW